MYLSWHYGKTISFIDHDEVVEPEYSFIRSFIVLIKRQQWSKPNFSSKYLTSSEFKIWFW